MPKAMIFMLCLLLLVKGRNEDGSWLEIVFGWIPAEHVQTDGDIMSLPVTG